MSYEGNIGKLLETIDAEIEKKSGEGKKMETSPNQVEKESGKEKEPIEMKRFKLDDFGKLVHMYGVHRIHLYNLPLKEKK